MSNCSSNDIHSPLLPIHSARWLYIIGKSFKDASLTVFFSIVIVSWSSRNQSYGWTDGGSLLSLVVVVFKDLASACSALEEKNGHNANDLNDRRAHHQCLQNVRHHFSGLEDFWNFNKNKEEDWMLLAYRVRLLELATTAACSLFFLVFCLVTLL